MKNHVWLPFALALLTSCGPASGADTTEEDDTAGGEDEAPPPRAHASARELIGINPPAAPWSEMTHEDKEMDMVGRFLPIFQESFQAHDAERYAGFSCEGCHGDDMREREFRMPSPHLPPIPLAGTPEYERMDAARHEVVEFMEHEVTEPMQIMLGMGETFTCNGCHPTPAAN